MAAKSVTVQATALMAEFRCVGASCEDTCCSGWEIDVDPQTLRKYARHPDLLASTTEDAKGHVMCRSADSGICAQHENGLCNIQAEYGEDYLGESCHFFPRSFRLLGDRQMGSMMLSCPETARMALFQPDMFSRAPLQLARGMSDLAQRLPKHFTTDEAMAMHDGIMRMLEDETQTADALLSRLVTLAHGLDETPASQWQEALRFYVNLPHVPRPRADAEIHFSLAQAVLSMATADRSQYRPRLYRSLRDIDRAFQLNFHWKHSSITPSPHSHIAWQEAQAMWQKHRWRYDAMLRNWLRAQIARIVFPFGGLGEQAAKQIFAITLAFATTRLALVAACYVAEGVVPENEQIRIVQSLARLFEHIDDISAFTLCYPHFYWQPQEPLHALLA